MIIFIGHQGQVSPYLLIKTQNKKDINDLLTWSRFYEP